LADPSAAESLSILLVSARRASRDEVAQVFDGQRGDTRLSWVSQPDLAAVRAQDLAARNPDQSGYQWLGLFHACDL
jgi:hypothetical protein